MIEKVRIFKTPLLANFLSKNLSVSKLCIKHQPQHYDIIITGGGLIGTTLACTLGKLTTK